MKEIIEITKQEATDDFTCSCGNSPDTQGFNPVDQHGKLLDDFGADDGFWYAQCDRCEQIYKLKDGEVAK